MNSTVKKYSAILLCFFFLCGITSVCDAQDSAVDSLEVIIEGPNVYPPHSSVDSVDNYKEDSSHNYDRQITVRAVPDSVVDKMQKQKEFLYANDPAYWKEEKPKDDGAFYKFLNTLSRSLFLKGVLYFLLALLIIFILYQVIAVNNFFIFSRSAKRKKVSGEMDEDGVGKDNIDEKIRMAINAGDYRGAIRLMYLNTLQSLNDKQLIRLHAKSTNYDYIQQMKQKKGENEFRLLTRIYEYVWYGEFQPSEQQFEIIHTSFNQFITAD
jgi:hypothetical protein